MAAGRYERTVPEVKRAPLKSLWADLTWIKESAQGLSNHGELAELQVHIQVQLHIKMQSFLMQETERNSQI